MIDSSPLCHTVRLQTYYSPGLLCAEEHPELLMALYLFSIRTYLHICPVPFVVSAVVSNRLQPMNTAITFFHTCCQNKIDCQWSLFVRTNFSHIKRCQISDHCHIADSMYRPVSLLRPIHSFPMHVRDLFPLLLLIAVIVIVIIGLDGFS